tara:strand:- start:230 stop:523 length:294 start_codon:yes stop_codon:yes gene_type:complete
MADVNAKSLNDVLGGAECYLGNLSELAGELSDVIVSEEGDLIKIENYQQVVKIIQVLWDKFKETAQECEGKTIEVKLGNDLVAMITKTTLSVLGFNL